MPDTSYEQAVKAGFAILFRKEPDAQRIKSRQRKALAARRLLYGLGLAPTPARILLRLLPFVSVPVKPSRRLGVRGSSPKYALADKFNDVAWTPVGAVSSPPGWLEATRSSRVPTSGIVLSTEDLLFSQADPVPSSSEPDSASQEIQ